MVNKHIDGTQLDMETQVKTVTSGLLTGSVGKARDTWLQGHEFKPHFGHGAYLKNKRNTKNLTVIYCHPHTKNTKMKTVVSKDMEQLKLIALMGV